MDDHGHDHDHGRGDASGHPEEMTEHEKRADEEHGRDVDHLERVTSPMQEFGTGEVGIGFVVLAVGLAVTFALPFLLT